MGKCTSDQNDRQMVARLTARQLLAAQEQIAEWFSELESRFLVAFRFDPDKLEECNGYTWIAYLKALKYGERVNAALLAYSVVRHIRSGVTVTCRTYWRKDKPNRKKDFQANMQTGFNEEDKDADVFSFSRLPSIALGPLAVAIANEVLAS